MTIDVMADKYCKEACPNKRNYPNTLECTNCVIDGFLGWLDKGGI